MKPALLLALLFAGCSHRLDGPTEPFVRNPGEVERLIAEVEAQEAARALDGSLDDFLLSLAPALPLAMILGFVLGEMRRRRRLVAVLADAASPIISRPKDWNAVQIFERAVPYAYGAERLGETRTCAYCGRANRGTLTCLGCGA